MATTPKLLLLFFFLFISSTSAGIDNLLPFYNLPKGLLPKDIKHYYYSIRHNSFTVELNSNPCYIEFGGQLFHYDQIIEGNLANRKMTIVSGIQAMESSSDWLYDVKVIKVDEANGMIEFRAGSRSRKIPAIHFKDVQSCKATAVQFQSPFLEMEALI